MSDPPVDEPAPPVSVHAVVFAVSAAAFALLLLVFIHLPEGITEEEETHIFVIGSVLVPLAGVAASWAITYAKRKLFPAHRLFYPLLAFSQPVFWAIATQHLRTLSPPIPAELGDDVDFAPHVARILIAWPIVTAAVFAVAAFTRRNKFDSPAWIEVAVWVDWMLPFLFVSALFPFAAKTGFARDVLIMLLVTGATSFMHQELARFPQQSLARSAFDGLVLVAIAVFLFDAAMDADPFHYNFYLGPVSAVRGGRSLLVDVNCQYGVGVIYFIASIFELHLRSVPPSLAGLSVIVSLLAIVQKWVIYGILRCITRSAALSALVIALMIAVTRFEPFAYPASYPSTGAIRFLLGFVLVLCFALRARFPERRSVFYVLEALTVGGASVWSFESFVYVAGAYVASIIYESFHVANRRALFALLRARLGPTLLAGLGFHLALAVLTHARSGEWPHWSRYFDYILLYSVQEFGTLPVETWTPWLPVVGTYLVTLIALGYRRITLGRSDLKAPYAVLFALSALGLAQFTYYVGRSHINNLLHVALPAFAVAAYWFVAAADDTLPASVPLRKSFAFVCYGAVAYLALTAFPDFVSKADHTWLWYVANTRAWRDPPPTQPVADATNLIMKYASQKPRVAFFGTPDVEVDTFLRVRKTSVWPESYPVQDQLLADARDRIVNAKTGLEPGDFVFVDTGSALQPNPNDVRLSLSIDPFDQELFKDLEGRFRFEVVESRPSGIAALRLVAR